MKRVIFIFSFLSFLYACSTYQGIEPPSTDWKTKKIPPSEQTEGGDPEKGFEFLVYGDYLGSGFPYELMKKRMKGERKDTILNRSGINGTMPFLFNTFEAANGVMVSNGNCFTCHASRFDGEMVLGLGNSFSDYKRNWSMMAKMVNFGVNLKYKKDSPEYEAFQPFGKYFKAMAPYIETDQTGVNPAAMLAEACVRHRDPVTLEYVEEPIFEMSEYVIPSDVPPLWNVKKKNALYYTAVGRGDFTKLLFQASVLGISDTSAARYAVTNFKDVVAWLKSLEPPEYPKEIDQGLASEGQELFEEHCSGCHGTYGKEESYPNKVVALKLIKTDPLYASYAVKAPIVEWYNKSWFAHSEPKSHFEPEAGYIAPPLDGIWATAPYLHNGSVPTLDDLLNSEQRPLIWSRSGNSRDYDHKKVGWNYQPEKAGKWIYDTTLPGYGNEGHYFGDKLRDGERKAVIEYLKTL